MAWKKKFPMLDGALSGKPAASVSMPPAPGETPINLSAPPSPSQKPVDAILGEKTKRRALQNIARGVKGS